MADAQLEKALAPVCGRMKLQAALDLAVKWLAAGALVAFGLAMCRIASSGWWPTAAALAVLAAAPLVGLVLGLISRPDLMAAARRIDDRYRLDDRTATSVAVTRQLAATGSEARPMVQILLRETTQRLQQVKAGDVVALRLPRGLLAALLLAVFAAAVALIPLAPESYFPGENDSASVTTTTNGSGPSFFAPPQAAPLLGSQSGRSTVHRVSVAVEASESSAPLDRGLVVERYFSVVENPSAQDLDAN